MRVKPLFSLLLSAALLAGAFSLSTGWAGQNKAKTDKLMTQTQQDGIIPALSNYSLLGELRSFDVLDIENHDFSAVRENVPGEIMEYARTAMQNDERLQYQSPAQGILRFTCASKDCYKIRAEVTQGFNGPVVWVTEEIYQPSMWVNTEFIPDSKKFAKQIVEKLAMDYQKAMKPVPMKINIKED